jgi:elongation factor Ts
MGDVKKVKQLREETGASISLCKKAIEACNYDYAAAKEYVAKHWEPARPKETTAGVIYTYVHGGRIGVMLEATAATDFVVRNETFQALCKELALQLVAGLEGSLEEQVYCRDGSKKIKDLIEDASKKVGEQIKVVRSLRWELGETLEQPTSFEELVRLGQELGKL